MKILIVDDEVDILTLFKDVLESVGHEVDIAIDGESGLKKFRDKKYDVIVMDYRMHGKNGIDVAEEMLKMDRNTKIIFASADSSIKEKALEMGAVGFLLKPFDIDQIIKEVEKIEKN